jgi:phosphoenolpyruvate-protein phosphotransferase
VSASKTSAPAEPRAGHLTGQPASGGIARGRWIRIDRTEPRRSAGPVSDPETEIRRLHGAASEAAAASVALAAKVRQSGHQAEAEIFSAHAAMAEDPELLDAADDRVRRERMPAPDAIIAVARKVADDLRALHDELLRGRAEDVVDVAEDLARRLLGEAAMTLDQPAIVVAHELPPSITATLPRERLLGIALEGSSPTSHAAILARAYGIPAVVGTTGLLAATAAAGPGAELAIDGSTGDVVVAPDAAELAAFALRDAANRRERDRDAAEAQLPCVTRDGTEVTLLANIGNPGESQRAIALGANGVGLFRTEFLFLERSMPPSEDEQLAAYVAVVRAFAPRLVTIRLLDVGGDKPIPYLPIPTEANPFLGVRALRLAGAQPEIFLAQLRACYRAALHGPVKVMAPMVADASDVTLLRDLAARARRELETRRISFGEIELGVMLEIPSAILVADTYFREIAFASIGTNDLLQYTLAADRGNANLTRYRDTLHPALLRLIADAVRAAERAGIPLSVCGEMAADPLAALALVGLGMRSLSMTSASIPTVRRAIRGVTRDAVADAAREALADSSADQARARFAELTPH